MLHLEHQSVIIDITGAVVRLTLMCFPLRPITKASSTSQSTSFKQTRDRDEADTVIKSTRAVAWFHTAHLLLKGFGNEVCSRWTSDNIKDSQNSQ